MSNGFDRRVPDEWLDGLWGAMLGRPQHRFLVTTAHMDRMASYLEDPPVDLWLRHAGRETSVPQDGLPANVWLGARASTSTELRERMPALLNLEAPVRVLKAVPLGGDLCDPTGDTPASLEYLGTAPEIDGWGGDARLQPHWRAEQGNYNMLAGAWWTAAGDPGFEADTAEEGLPRLHWVIAGGTSGPRSEPVHPEWLRGLRDLCEGYGTPFRFDGWGDWGWQESLNFDEAARVAGDREYQGFICGRTAIRVGADIAGRCLDGRAHDGVPAADTDWRRDERPVLSCPRMRQEAAGPGLVRGVASEARRIPSPDLSHDDLPA